MQIDRWTVKWNDGEKCSKNTVRKIVSKIMEQAEGVEASACQSASLHEYQYLSNVPPY